MIKLRPYQVEPVRIAIDFFRRENPDPALIIMPTGSGKSILAAEVAAACPDPILVVQPTKELLEQNLEKYRLLCGDLAPAGVYSASFGKKQIDHVTFATIGSIKSCGARFRELGFKKMLIDEAHLYPRKEESMLGEFLRDSGIRHVLGITATPLKLEQFAAKVENRFDKWSELIILTNPSQDGSFFREVLYAGQIQEMIRLKFWSPLVYEILPFDPRDLRLNSTGGEFADDAQELAYKLNNIRQNIFGALNWHSERKHCLVFVPSVEEAAILANEYPGSAYISGETPAKERRQTIKDFREGKIRVLFNCLVLSVGFDYTQIDMIVLAMSTASVARYYQILGRGVRIHPDKRDCLIVDMGGNVNRFGRIEDIRFKKGRDIWRMYGTDGRLLTGIPIGSVGHVLQEDVNQAHLRRDLPLKMDFGKYAGKWMWDIPMTYRAWLITRPETDPRLRWSAILTVEHYLRDTTGEPPAEVLPDGQHAGKPIREVPRGYLSWYYKSKTWTETNDSLRRGLLAVLKQK